MEKPFLKKRLLQTSSKKLFSETTKGVPPFVISQ